jgi:hypothetical protein
MTTKDYTNLVNGDRIRLSIKRLFTGNVAEILSELLQNSQRAGATQIIVTTHNNSFTFEDNGHGIANIDGFYNLLKIAESDFQNPDVNAQAPMGLGINALLAHEEVTSVIFHSGGLSLDIDTQRWFTDREYYTNWTSRLEPTTTYTGGLCITVKTKGKLPTTLASLLSNAQNEDNPALGYGDLLSLSVNGADIPLIVPKHFLPLKSIIKTTYQDCDLHIGPRREAGYKSQYAYINWFGQIIPSNNLPSLAYYLHVRGNKRPVNPMAPSRRGLINDSALQALLKFIEDAVFVYLLDPTNRDKLTPDFVRDCYLLNNERARQECPYILVQRWVTPRTESFDDFIQNCDHYEIASYQQSPPLVNHHIETPSRASEGWIAYTHGTATFISMIEKQLGPVYQLAYGNKAILNIMQLYWKPGESRPDMFNEPGQWGLSSADQEPEHWFPVTELPVFAFEDTDCEFQEGERHSDKESYIVVGCNDPISFLDNEAWALFDPADDEDYDPQRETFAYSIHYLIMRLLGEAVLLDLKTLSRLRHKMSDNRSPILNVAFHYNPQETEFPNSVTVQNAAGETKHLKLRLNFDWD